MRALPPASPPAPTPRRRKVRNSTDDPISQGLRRLWATVEDEPVPADLLALITRIDALNADADAAADTAADEGAAS